MFLKQIKSENRLRFIEMRAALFLREQHTAAIIAPMLQAFKTSMSFKGFIAHIIHQNITKSVVHKAWPAMMTKAI